MKKEFELSTKPANNEIRFKKDGEIKAVLTLTQISEDEIDFNLTIYAEQGEEVFLVGHTTVILPDGGRAIFNGDPIKIRNTWRGLLGSVDITYELYEAPTLVKLILNINDESIDVSTKQSVI
jgi:hypothetical protein